MPLSWSRLLRAAGLLVGIGLGAQAPAPPPPDRPVVVGVDTDYFPFEFGDAQGRVGGFTVELLQAIARDEGLRLTFRPDAWTALRRDLDAGQIDLMAGMFRSPAREATLAFTQAHIQVDYAIFTRPGAPAFGSLEDLRGRSLFVQEATVIHERLVEMGFPGTIHPVASERMALLRLAGGSGDAAIVTQLGGNALMRELGLTQLRASGAPFRDLDYCFAAPRDRQDLVVRLDRGLAHLRATGEYDRIYRQWFGWSQPGGLERGLRIAAWVGLPLLALLGLILLWNLTLRRTVEARTRELRVHQDQLEALVQARTADLQGALEDVKRLSGLLPICAACKKVRDDQGFWTQVEAYIETHSEATFTHGLCPECTEHLYPEVTARRRARAAEDPGNAPDPQA